VNLLENKSNPSGSLCRPNKRSRSTVSERSRHVQWTQQCHKSLLVCIYDTIRYDTTEEFNVDSKAEYSSLSSTRSQKKKLKQTTPVPL